MATSGSGSSFTAKINSYVTEVGNRIKQPEERARLLETFKTNVMLIINGVMKNVREGELGKRGEEWFVAQLAIAAVIFFGVPFFLSGLVHLSGYAYLLSGVLFIVNAVWELRENTSPFVSPSSGNQMVTTGAYRYVRHPMYGGLVLTCLGLSILSNSIEKLLLTALLLYVLDRKASLEESLLQSLHPSYAAYINGRKKILPYIL
eukprot:CAMPEP_0173186868 /NCGR_PEP_ID=MMETSP1141-20130122/10376_1 /TAXON_ID=483371 /ORGANISM="non described non described, Strain CCMP2298" /LENGTH=203 /DNA_ID=CAMNT_0014110609 /DNA_START=146 /DNA_END=757 /DNA_ORIENTATION=+